MEKMKKELLAPAGNMTCLHAAISAGADAVYLGLDVFNARRGADNFTLETLSEACDYAHLRGKKIYLAFNTVVLPEEVDTAFETARQAYRHGVDAFIIQDIGLAAEIVRILPNVPVHASTQMNIHSVEGVEALSVLGAKRVTLARELSVAKIELLSTTAKDKGIETEVFAHGALCVCYSGQCFMSSMIGGRSANRGLCAQACRLPYTLHNKALQKNLNAPGEHLLSPKDLCVLDLLPELLAAGVSSFKIEGRMKSPEYVHTVTSVYRRALDEALVNMLDQEEIKNLPVQDPSRTSSHSPHTSTHEEDKKLLAEAFSRGFTTAYLENKRGNEIMSYTRPNNRGVLIGRVASVQDRMVTFAAETELAKGDLLEFWTKKGNFVHEIDALDFDKKGNVRLSVAKPAGKGDRVFRVRRSSLVFHDDVFEPHIPLTGTIALQVGRPLHLTLETEGGVSVETEGPLVEKARTKAVTRSEVEDHINRFGNTPFSLTDLKISLDENVGIGFSTLHKVRSRALTLLQERILEPYKDRKLVRVEARESVPPYHARGCTVVALASNPACARAAKRAGAENIYVSALHYKRGESSIAGQVSQTAEQGGYPKQSIIMLPEVEHSLLVDTREAARDFDVWKYVKPGKPLVVQNLGQLISAQDSGMKPEVGSSLPLLNELALEQAYKQGATRAWLSPELSYGQITQLAKASPLPLGLTIMGAQKLMTTEHCLLMSQGDCNEECAQCARRRSPHYLKDRKGYELPVLTDCCGRSHLYNAVALDVAHAVADLVRVGISALMVDTTLMNVAETTEAVGRAVRARNIALSGDNKVSKKEETTSGLLFRGVQ